MFDKDLSLESLNEVLSCSNLVFSRKGMSDLLFAINKQSRKKDWAAVFTCSPYTFVIASFKDQFILIDTHPVPESCGGDGNGVVFFSEKNCQFKYADICMWLWKRLWRSGIRNDRHQSFSVLWYVKPFLVTVRNLVSRRVFFLTTNHLSIKKKKIPWERGWCLWPNYNMDFLQLYHSIRQN